MLAHNNCFSWLPSTVVYTASNSSEKKDTGNDFRTAPSPRTLLTLLISTDASADVGLNSDISRHNSTVTRVLSQVSY